MAGGLGVPITDELVRAWFEAEARHHVAWREGRVSFQEQRRRRLLDFLPLIGAPVDGDLDAMFEPYAAAYEAAFTGYPDVAAGLEAVARARLSLGVLTNGTVDQQNAKVRALGLEGRLGPVVTAEELGVAKPHRQAYALFCARLGVAAEEVLYVGDNYDLDVVAARATGLRALHLDRDGTGSEESRIRTLAELGPHLGQP